MKEKLKLKIDNFEDKEFYCEGDFFVENKDLTGLNCEILSDGIEKFLKRKFKKTSNIVLFDRHGMSACLYDWTDYKGSFMADIVER